MSAISRGRRNGGGGGYLATSKRGDRREQFNLVGVERSLVRLSVSVKSTQMGDDISNLLEEEGMLRLSSYSIASESIYSIMQNL